MLPHPPGVFFVLLSMAVGLFTYNPDCRAQGPRQRNRMSGRQSAVQPSQTQQTPMDFSKFAEAFSPIAPDDEKALESINVSPREEQQLGDGAAQAYLSELKQKQIKAVSRGKDVAYLKRLVETLRPQMLHADRYWNIRVYVAESAELEAKSFPGGTLVFFRGLLDRAESEAALVGVVGHELSHLDHGHQLATLRKAKLTQETFSAKEPFSPDRFLARGQLLMRAWMRPFRPEDETQADLDGATWAYRSGYDPRELAALLLKLHDNGPPGHAWGFLRTHPFSLDRHRAILSTYETLQHDEPRESLYVGRRNLQQRTSRAEKQFAGETARP